jgi:hypothetical protein
MSLINEFWEKSVVWHTTGLQHPPDVHGTCSKLKVEKKEIMPVRPEMICFMKSGAHTMEMFTCNEAAA